MPPRILGRYALYDKIASGGMATVHLGRLLGPAGFARTVAVKRLHSHYAEDPDFVSMFLDEARLAARIHHPNVVPVIDVVATDGELLLVMEYVKGECLARLVRLSTEAGVHVPPPIASTVMAGVLHGLHAAHEARDERGEPLGIVHRDVSPQNVLVGVDGVARVVDFGVAKAAGRIQTTREGQLKGKLAYMAPEQLQGTVSRSTDIYAAAVVLWEALVGHRLFDGETEAELFNQLVERRVLPPSRYAPDVPSALDAVVLRGLSRDPATRFATAQEMACALEDVIVGVGASKVGAWVESTARDALGERTRLVERVESVSAVEVPQPPGSESSRPSAYVSKRDSRNPSARPPPRSPPPSPPVPPGEASAVLTQNMVLTQQTSSSLSASWGSPAHGRRRAALLGVAAGLVFFGIIAFTASRWTSQGDVSPKAFAGNAPPPLGPAVPASPSVPAPLAIAPPATASTAAPPAPSPAPPPPAAVPRRRPAAVTATPRTKGPANDPYSRM